MNDYGPPSSSGISYRSMQVQNVRAHYLIQKVALVWAEL